MQFTRNSDGSVVTAYLIDTVTAGDGYYIVTLPERGSIIGLLPSHTESYVPVSGDYYIDNGDVPSSEIKAQGDFLASYTGA